jgi:hypothetical protein
MQFGELGKKEEKAHYEFFKSTCRKLEAMPIPDKFLRMCVSVEELVFYFNYAVKFDPEVEETYHVYLRRSALKKNDNTRDLKDAHIKKYSIEAYVSGKSKPTGLNRYILEVIMGPLEVPKNNRSSQAKPADLEFDTKFTGAVIDGYADANNISGEVVINQLVMADIEMSDFFKECYRKHKKSITEKFISDSFKEGDLAFKSVTKHSLETPPPASTVKVANLTVKPLTPVKVPNPINPSFEDEAPF